MNPITVFFMSGTSFWAGLVLLVAGLALTLREARWWQRAGARLLLVLGWLGVALSSAPLPGWASWWLFLALSSVLLALHFPEEYRAGRGALCLRLALLLAALVVAGLEFPHWRLPPIPAGQHRRMAVIGDSISAGVGFAGERTWHEVFAEETGIAVDALAVGGGTCASAFPDAARISPDAALVLLEIGGNDILGRTPLPRYAADLDRLLAAVAVPGRTVVMLEVPVPPLHAGFCAAQRRLAAKHGVVLLPRRVFSAFLQGREATVDGLHLSNLGHRRMGRRLAAILAPALARDVRTAP